MPTAAIKASVLSTFALVAIANIDFQSPPMPLTPMPPSWNIPAITPISAPATINVSVIWAAPLIPSPNPKSDLLSICFTVLPRETAKATRTVEANPIIAVIAIILSNCLPIPITLPVVTLFLSKRYIPPPSAAITATKPIIIIVMAAAPAISSSGFKLNFLTIIPVINIKPVATAANAITRPPNAAALANKATLMPAGGGGTFGVLCRLCGFVGSGFAVGFSPPNPNILARNPMIPPLASGLVAFAF